MESIREVIRRVIERRVLPWIERDGISKLLLPEQITPAHCAEEVKPKRSRSLRYRYRDPELAIGLTGKFLHCIDGKVVVFTPGMMVLIPAGIPRRLLQTAVRFTENINTDRPSLAMWMRSYPSCVWTQLARVADDGDVLEATQPCLLPGQHFSRLMADLLEEVRSRRPYYAGVGRYILLEFMQRCLRATTSTMSAAVVDVPAVPARRGARNKPVRSGSKQPPSQVQAAQEFIHAHYHIPISLDDIANAASLSVNHLGRLFKTATGMTPIAYLLEVRIAAARQLLLTDMKVSEVGHLVGIDDASYFGRVFRRSNGVTPICYRQRMAKSAKRP